MEAPAVSDKETTDKVGQVPPDEFIEAVQAWMNKWPAEHLAWRIGDLYDRIVTAGFVRSATTESAAVQELNNIAYAKRFDRSLFYDDKDFADWAQSRCRHTLAQYVSQGTPDA